MNDNPDSDPDEREERKMAKKAVEAVLCPTDFSLFEERKTTREGWKDDQRTDFCCFRFTLRKGRWECR